MRGTVLFDRSIPMKLPALIAATAAFLTPVLLSSCAENIEHRQDNRTDRQENRLDRREIRQDARQKRTDAWYDRKMH